MGALKTLLLAVFPLLLPLDGGSQAVVLSPKGGDSSVPQRDLTDEERNLSETYLDESLGNKIFREECDKLKDPEACRGVGQTEFLGIDSEIIRQVSKAYAMLMGTMFQGGLKGAKPKVAENSQATKGAGGPKNDYCVLIGGLAETAGFAMQEISNESLKVPAGGRTTQSDALYRAARSHEDRAGTAKIQAAGWGASSACYGYMLSYGGADPTAPSNLAKLAAAGVLTGFYWWEHSQQQKYADAVKKIAEKLPKPGDCNPVTETNCYCAKSAEEIDPRYAHYCRPQVHARKIAAGSMRSTCINDKLAADPKCKCMQSNSCFDTILEKEFKSDGNGRAFIASPIGSDSLSLARGELKQGALTSTAMRRNAALTSFLEKSGQLPAKVPTGSRKVVSLLADKFRIPPPLAGYLVAHPSPAGATKQMAKWKERLAPARAPRKYAQRRRSGSRNLDFAGGRGINRKKGKKSGAKNSFDFKKYLAQNKKKRRSKRGEVLLFSERAINSAEISKDKDKNLFHIISRRYILTAPKRLGVNK